MPGRLRQHLRLTLLTTLALVAFAGNSLLCRMALRETQIDPASFTAVRLIAGAVVLWLLLATTGRSLRGAGSWPMALALFIYAAAFSFAYIGLSTGTGALLLFGAVQLGMLGTAWRQGQRLSGLQWCGLALACVGLVVLLSPGLTAPPPGSALLMLIAGLAWAAYSLLGRGHPEPTRTTAGNFVRCVPLAALLAVATLPWARVDGPGIALAVASGAITSGLGYAIWYTALRSLGTVQAASAQLSVPVIAALMGLVALAEPIDARFTLSAAAVLGGIALTLVRTGAAKPESA